MTVARDYLLCDGTQATCRSADALRAVAREHALTLAALRGRNRTKRVVTARREFICRAYKLGARPSQIARVLNRDRTTVLHHLRVVGLR